MSLIPRGFWNPFVGEQRAGAAGPLSGLFGRRRFTPDPFDRLFGDDDALMTSSFLDSMIPREHISDMNQFDFVCDIVEKKDRYTLSGELRVVT
ncbi:unnamed protein product [Bathycoccus prasinos]